MAVYRHEHVLHSGIAATNPDVSAGWRTMDVENDQAGVTQATLATVERFNAAFNTHDVEAIMALMTDDVVFENTSPAPDGERYQGQQAVGQFWQQFFASSPQARFKTEDIFAAGNRCVVCWTYYWNDTGHVRGVDIFTVHDGKIARKLSYVKG